MKYVSFATDMDLSRLRMKKIDIRSYTFSVFWDDYENMWVAECREILERQSYLCGCGPAPENALTALIQKIPEYIKRSLRCPDAHVKT